MPSLANCVNIVCFLVIKIGDTSDSGTCIVMLTALAVETYQIDIAVLVMRQLC